MGEHSAISWTDATLNALHGCDRVSAGCKNCYALTLSHRLARMPGQKMQEMYGGTTLVHANGQVDWSGTITFVPRKLAEPLRWRGTKMVFVNSMSDLFHPDVQRPWILAHWALFALTPRHTYQILTKRPERMAALLADPAFAPDVWAAARQMARDQRLPEAPEQRVWPLRNVWLGTSTEDQPAAEARIPHLLATPAAVRFLSCEPLLGPLDLRHWIGTYPVVPGGSTYTPADGIARYDWGNHAVDGLHWVITGGESGPHFRPADHDWFRGIRDQCVAAGVCYWHKQDAGQRPGHNTLLDGRLWQERPDAP